MHLTDHSPTPFPSCTTLYTSANCYYCQNHAASWWHFCYRTQGWKAWWILRSWTSLPAFSAASSQYSILKKYSVSCQGRKKSRSVHEWWSSEGVGIQALAGLSVKKTGCGRSSGSASTESALQASSAARSLLISQHRIVPQWLDCFLPRKSEGEQLKHSDIVGTKTWLTDVVLSSRPWSSVRPGMLWCCSTPFPALSLQCIFPNKQVWIRLRDDSSDLQGMAWLEAVVPDRKPATCHGKWREKNESEQGIRNATFSGVSRKLNVLYEAVESQKEKKRKENWKYCSVSPVSLMWEESLPNSIVALTLITSERQGCHTSEFSYF